MSEGLRLARYLLTAAVLFGLAALGPQAWATPAQEQRTQFTVPTRTPKPSPPTPTPEPTAEPTATPTAEPPTEPTAESTPFATVSPTPPLPASPTATSVPEKSPSDEGAPPEVPAAATSSPTPLPSPIVPQSPPLDLRVRVVPSRAWVGVTATYTVTVTNRSSEPARNVVVVAMLPVGLAPAEIVSAEGASWTGRTLRAEMPLLPPRGNYVVVFKAIVGADAPRRGVLLVPTSVSAVGQAPVTVSSLLALPPQELPRVGNDTVSGPTEREGS